MIYQLIHRLNYMAPLPRGRWMLRRFAQQYSSLPQKLSDVRIDYGLLVDIETGDEVDVRIYFNILDTEIKPIIKKFIRQGDTVLDIGANIGYFSLLMAHCVGHNGKVHSFEPNPVVRQRLVQHVIKNGFKDIVTVHPSAISDVSGTLQLNVYDVGNHGLSSIVNRPGMKPMLVEAQVDTLDDLFSRGEIGYPSFIKIDVEGAELLVLKGGEEFIRQVRPTIVAEMGPLQKELFDYTAAELWHWVDQHNYSFGFLHPYKGYQKVSLEVADSLPEGNILLTPV